jgi:hypothetical protein
MTNLDDLIASVESGSMPESLPAPLQALWQDARGDWDHAHRIVQADDSAAAAWVHAYLHRKEGDPANAAYWYRRAKRPACDDALENEWRSIAGALLGQDGAG